MQRLFLRHRLASGAVVDLDRGQANYLTNVLRLGEGAEVLVFNGTDGEWTAVLKPRDRRIWSVATVKQEREQPPPPDLRYLFAPLKQARLDYMVQKAVEMGAGRLTPIMTQHGQVSRVNLQRMESNAIEAAEQCGILSIPVIDKPMPLGKLIDEWAAAEPERRVIFCDEAAENDDPIAVLGQIRETHLALLVGPEGGFSAEERTVLRARPFVTAIGLGPRIMRADTAAVAALALVQAVLGDWRARNCTPISTVCGATDL